MICGSSTRSEPAAALRGLAKRESPCSSRSAFSRSKARRFITVSPRTSKSGEAGSSTRSGSERMVRAFSVTSSPTVPSPRVTAWAKRAVAIMGRHREAVQLQFGDVAECGAAQQFAHAAVEIAQLPLVERVVQAQHRRAVPHLDEAFARLAAHALAWANRASAAPDAALPAPAAGASARRIRRR